LATPVSGQTACSFAIHQDSCLPVGWDKNGVVLKATNGIQN
jgi:hypothetical protein